MKTKAIASIMIVLFLASMLSISVPIVEASPADLHVYAPTQLTTDGGHYLGSFSPDGTKIVYTAADGIYIMNADGTNAINIYPSGTRPDWGSPIDGYPNGLIALAGTGITIIEPEGDLVKWIDITHPYPPDPTRTATLTHSLDWSPDGAKIAFATSQWTSGIWTVDYNTETLTKITDYSNPAYSPTWSSDGTEIACSWGSSTNMFVGVFKSDGTQTTPLRTIGIGGSYGGDYPDWGSNGKLVYSVGAAKQLYVMDGDGSNNVKIFDGPAVMAAWSPDCAKILYIDGFTNKNIWVRGYYSTIQSAINAASSGDTIRVHPGTYVEIGQIVIGKDLTIIGESSSTPIIKPSADTGSTGDARGWFLVQSGVNFNLESVTLDGSGRKVFQAIRHRGQGTITKCIFMNIKFGESGPNYAGFGIVAFGDPGNVDVTDCEFSEIGRVGVLYFGSGITDSTFSGNEYTGKGVGDWLDYAVEVGAGAHVTITGNTISNNLGVASVDGSTSAGILVTTYFGSGSVAVITYNTISGCTDGIAVGYDDADTSVVTAHYNNIFGNAMGISSTAWTVDAEYNWWGNLNGPYDPLGTVEMPYEPEPSVSDMKNTEPVGNLGDEVSEYVDYYPWLRAPLEVYATLDDLKIEINTLPDDDLKPPAADRKAALIDKINDVIAKIDAGDYHGAIMKLKMDIEPKLDASTKQTWLVEDHSELLTKINTVIELLEGLL